jgi:hypothetical protein
MGSGKSEFSARIYRDSEVAMRKSEKVRQLTTSDRVDRRNVFYIRSKIDDKRFKEYPANSIAYRGGYVVPGNNIASIQDSFELEGIFESNPTVGTWIIDEVEFFDERIAYVIVQHGRSRPMCFPSPPIASTPTVSLILITPTGFTLWGARNAPRFSSIPSLLWVATSAPMTRRFQTIRHAVTITIIFRAKSTLS